MAETDEKTKQHQVNAEKIKLNDFIKLNYTGRLADNTVFDTTKEDLAKKNNLHAKKIKYSPLTICVGEKQILPGLDEELIGKEIGKTYTITLPPEKAFGKRDIKNMRIVPANVFKEHKMQPQPGLQIDVDGQLGIVTRVSGGRVIVNFNHPLAGKIVVYEIEILERITDVKEQLQSFLHSALRIPKEKIKIEISEDEEEKENKKAEITLPVNLPQQLTEIFAKKLEELTRLKKITFKNEIKEKQIK